MTSGLLYIYNIINMRTLAYAKLNLCLSVLGVKDGRHVIDSVFYPAPIFDEIYAGRADELTVEYTDGRVYERDTAVLAGRAVTDGYKAGGARIVIKKNIPEGAGLGGSSADAGAVARILRELYSLPDIDEKILSSVGSDVPYFYRGGCARVGGTGEIVQKIDLPKLYTVAVVPKGGVNTGECYRLYDEIGGESGDADEFLSSLRRGENPKPFNALGRAAQTLNEGTEKARLLLEKAGFKGGITGSGSAAFGMETDEAKFAFNLKKLIEYAPPSVAVYYEKEQR